jgi:hypothetical protein
VPSAKSAETAKSADTAKVAEQALHVPAPEAQHFVGTPGEPPFVQGWTSGASEIPGFYMDRDGVVHLDGRVFRTQGANATVFFLPQAYRPRGEHEYAIASEAAGAELAVTSSGAVIVRHLGDESNNNKVISMNGISWIAGR